MTDAELFPEPRRVPGGVDSEADLISGADNGPDILYGVEEDEPDLGSIPLHDVPFRTPHAGERLSDAELEHDLDTEN